MSIPEYGIPNKLNVKVMSPGVTFTIPNAVNGSAVTPADLGANFEAFLIVCADAGGIDATTGLTVQMSPTAAGTMYPVYTKDDPATVWTKTPLLATADPFAFVFTQAEGARRLLLVLSKVTTAAVTLTIYGMGRLF